MFQCVACAIAFTSASRFAERTGFFIILPSGVAWLGVRAVAENALAVVVAMAVADEAGVVGVSVVVVGGGSGGGGRRWWWWWKWW